MVKIKTELIRFTLAERNIPMTQAAQEAGVSYGNFCEIMKRGTCNGTTLGKLARFCGVKAWELVDV